MNVLANPFWITVVNSKIKIRLRDEKIRMMDEIEDGLIIRRGRGWGLFFPAPHLRPFEFWDWTDFPNGHIFHLIGRHRNRHVLSVKKSGCVLCPWSEFVAPWWWLNCPSGHALDLLCVHLYYKTPLLRMGCWVDSLVSVTYVPSAATWSF